MMIGLMIVALFLIYQALALRRLSLLADEALANRFLEAGRLKLAKARVALYEREERHMCLRPGCRNPVVGKWAFAHCELHLEPNEQRWLRDDLETKGFNGAPEDGEHSSVKQAREGHEAHIKELVMQSALRIKQARNDAYDLIKNARLQEVEREAYLPRKLLYRIKNTEQAEGADFK